jgi:hypothetical protein
VVIPIDFFHYTSCRLNVSDSLSHISSPAGWPFIASIESDSVIASNLSFTIHINVSN